MFHLCSPRGRSLATRAVFFFAFSATGLVACGVRTSLDGIEYVPVAVSVDSGTTPIAVDAGPPVLVADSGGDHASPGPVDAGPDDDVALPPSDLGNLFLTSGSYQNGSVQTLTAVAEFFPSVTATGCSIVPIGACTIETCQNLTMTAPLTGAGTVTVTGGAYPLVLSPGAGDVYAITSGAPADDGGDDASFEDGGTSAPLTLWTGGETLVASAGGDTVPAFLTTIVAPTQLTILTPMPQYLVRGAPFAFSWTGRSAGQVVLDLDGLDLPSDGHRYLECRYDAAAGTGEFPAEALQAMPQGTMTLTVSTMNEGKAMAGGWAIDAFAQTNAGDPEGKEYTGAVGLQ